MFRSLAQQLTQPVLEANSEGGLHDLADALVGQQQPHGGQHQRAEHLHDLHKDNLVGAGVHAHEPGDKTDHQELHAIAYFLDCRVTPTPTPRPPCVSDGISQALHRVGHVGLPAVQEAVGQELVYGGQGQAGDGPSHGLGTDHVQEGRQEDAGLKGVLGEE